MSHSLGAEAPPCSVHPFGYHQRSRVTRADSVLSEPGLVRVPARCLALERELEESSRVDDFVRHLWVVERAGRPGAGLVLATIVLVGALAAMVLMAADEVLGWQIGLGAGVAVTAGLIAERVALRAHRTRLRRVYQWREYVGFQA
jgi:hypothetical protein